MPISSTNYFIRNVKAILEREHLSITELPQNTPGKRLAHCITKGKPRLVKLSLI